jgi:hypothetical protein
MQHFCATNDVKVLGKKGFSGGKFSNVNFRRDLEACIPETGKWVKKDVASGGEGTRRGTDNRNPRESNGISVVRSGPSVLSKCGNVTFREFSS